MERYDYYEAVRSDVADYISENIDLAEWTGNREGLEEQLNDDLWTVDSVTGNGNGSYTFSTWQAEENLCHNLDLLTEAMREFGSSFDLLEQGAEAVDVTIRCYLLGRSISEVLDDLESDGAFDEDEEEDEEEEE